MMDRREPLYRASMLLGGAVSASVTAGVLAGCTTTSPGLATAEDTRPPQAFSTPERWRL